MCAKAPEGVLVRADLAEVLAVPVDIEDIAELARVHELLELHDAGVVEQEVPRHECEPLLLGEGDELLRLGRAKRHRLLDEDVLPGGQRAACQLEVCDDGGRDRDRIERRILEQVVETLRAGGPWEAARDRCELRCVLVAEPYQLGPLGEVPREIRTPVAEAGDPDAAQSFHTRLFVVPFFPVALRKSTTRRARSTSRS